MNSEEIQAENVLWNLPIQLSCICNSYWIRKSRCDLYTSIGALLIERKWTESENAVPIALLRIHRDKRGDSTVNLFSEIRYNNFTGLLIKLFVTDGAFNTQLIHRPLCR